MLLISSQCFTAIKESGKNDSSVYLDFGCLRDASPIPRIPVVLAKGCTRFCESGIHFVIHDNRFGEGAAEVGELFYLLSLDSDVGLDEWFSRRWLVHHFCLFFSWWLGQSCHSIYSCNERPFMIYFYLQNNRVGHYTRYVFETSKLTFTLGLTLP